MSAHRIDNQLLIAREKSFTIINGWWIREQKKMKKIPIKKYAHQSCVPYGCCFFCFCLKLGTKEKKMKNFNFKLISNFVSNKTVTVLIEKKISNPRKKSILLAQIPMKCFIWRCWCWCCGTSHISFLSRYLKHQISLVFFVSFHISFFFLIGLTIKFEFFLLFQNPIFFFFFVFSNYKKKNEMTFSSCSIFVL